TQAKPGPFLAVGTTNNTGIFSWAAVSGGSAGTNACPSATTGTFATSSSTTTLASNVATAINRCPAAAGLTPTSSTNTVTATHTLVCTLAGGGGPPTPALSGGARGALRPGGRQPNRLSHPPDPSQWFQPALPGLRRRRRDQPIPGGRARNRDLEHHQGDDSQ